MATPCRRTRPSQPENVPPITAPTAVAASSMPTVRAPPPNHRAATAGNSARGWASTMADRSEKNVMRRLGRVAQEPQSLQDGGPLAGAGPAALREHRGQPEHRVEAAAKATTSMV